MNIYNMKLLTIGSLLLTICRLTAAGLTTQQATSYAAITKHDSSDYVDRYDHIDYYQHNDDDDGHHHDLYTDYYSHPKYDYKYGVKDLKTGDVKDQWEQRDGDRVTGGYTFTEADGTIRVVEYTADDVNGFQAVVKNIGHAYHSVELGSQWDY